ncbi:Predicted transcriptional regulator [Parafrankia irregularis]|uniref:Predicted transcriptional regulator n=1 Tax=Parafrankia irregularis TaxID=795642 RepID=A0A0S4QJN2_9ACTN|nr:MULTISPECIES: BlaI/MecI/CopY family transcriptional regulator [Parafrankia]MBE3205615.1 BlaI/MecI/CopY family transcriptional regulator [Parafrankia sp. CH37]CUU55486.1 Predicted transcriptional regulator [Parafrankia irregularis]
MAGRTHPRPSGGLENEVVACLAAADGPMTAAQVQAELGDDLAYTTILTTLRRLHEKQALTRVPRGRAYAYQLVGSLSETQAGLTARQMQKLLDAGTDRARVLSQFVGTLDEDSERILRELLARHPGPDQTTPASDAQEQGPQ